VLNFETEASRKFDFGKRGCLAMNKVTGKTGYSGLWHLWHLKQGKRHKEGTEWLFVRELE